MDSPTLTSSTRWAPESLGPLGDPTSISTTPGTLFPGDDRYFSRRQLTRRVQLTDQVAGVLTKTLEPEEQILAVVPALEVPGVFDILALGWLWAYYHKVVLVLTDWRLIEMTLTPGGKPSSRIRSVPWSQVEVLKRAVRGIRIKTRAFRRVWRVQHGGDRKLLKALLPRIREHVLGITADSGRKVPLWHCPECGAANAEAPAACTACGVGFRHHRMAWWLAVAFPGAGVLYAGHPVLALFDFVGEAFLYVLYLVLTLGAAGSVGEQMPGVALGLGLLALTKLESVHLAGILVRRRTEPLAREPAARWETLAKVASVVTLLAVLVPLFFLGSLVPGPG